jgi:hypothetical protein
LAAPTGQLADRFIRLGCMSGSKMENMLHFRKHLEPDIDARCSRTIGEPPAVIE